MKPRQDITELFSTFIQFADDYFSHWVVDPKLRRNLQLCLQSIAPAAIDRAESFWALYWYRCWQAKPNGLAIAHLSAYLQEACYWAARNLSLQQGSLPDYFQMAIADLPKILSRYDPHQLTSLKVYAGVSFSNAIRDALRQRGEADSRSDWGLLRKVSQKRLVEALQMAGFSQAQIAQYCLVWTCFKTCWAPNDQRGSRQLARPNAATWDAIASLYNRQRLHQRSPAPFIERSAILERWLQDCARQLRTYLHPQTTSLNLDRFEPGSGDLQAELPDLSGSSPLADLIAQEEQQERQNQQQQVSQVLTAALARLKPEVRQLLELYYQQGLTQQEIAARLEIKQYTVSRRLSSAKAELLLALARWSQETLHIALASPVVSQMNMALEEWLQLHYPNANLLPSEEDAK